MPLSSKYEFVNIYWNGLGVSVNNNEAIKWYRLAGGKGVLKAVSHVNNELKNFDFDLEKINVEHIASASGRNLATIRKDAGLESKEDFENYVNQVGNKILLDENINKSIGNDWFRTKKEKYKDSKRVGLVKKIADYNKPVWTKEDIDKMTREHTIRIVKFVTSKKQ